MATDQVETIADYKGDIVLRWLDAIKLAGKRQRRWEEKGDKVVNRYRDDRSDLDTSKKFNILWSNIETLKPAVYSQVPKPAVSRRFKDADPLGRVAAMVLERALEYSVDSYDFNSVMKAVVEDYLLPGRGTSRVVYEPSYGEPEPELDDLGAPRMDDEGRPATYTPVAYEEAKCKYHFWKDFRHGPGRVWDEVPWVAYRNYMDRQELRERFPEHADKIPLNYTPEDCGDQESAEQFKKAVVWEVWNKSGRETLWIAEDYTEVLDQGQPPLNLHGFFPGPKPLYSLVTNGNLIPVPDYCQYQDQAEELDRLSGRIDVLLDALRVAGFYAGEEKDNISRIFTDAGDNTLIAVDSWAMWAEKGGVKGMIDWYPVDQVMQVIVALYEAREKTKQELYEITGLSDILRGASNPTETATAQRIKGQFATLRVSDRQKLVQEYARDLIRMKAEIICEHFSLQTLQIMTGMQLPTRQEKQMAQQQIQMAQQMGQQVPPEMQKQLQKLMQTPDWESVIELLQNDPLRSFKIDIETDSTIQADEQADKEARIEFLTAMTQFIQQIAQVGPAAPQLMPLFGQMMMFAVRGFRAGRDLEDAFEQAMSGMEQQAQQPAPPDPRAEAEAAKAKAETEKMQMEMQKMQQELAKIQQQMQQDQAIFRQKVEQDQAEFQHERQLKNAEFELKKQEAEQDMELQRMKATQQRAGGE